MDELDRLVYANKLIKRFLHVQERMKERYDIDISPSDYDHMNELVNNDNKLVTFREGSSYHKINVFDTDIYVVYKDGIRTVLTLDMVYNGMDEFRGFKVRELTPMGTDLMLQIKTARMMGMVRH